MTGISERIESVLAELKISRRELSRRAGLSPSHVEQLTAGRVATPSAVVISAIAHAAGVSVDWLATGADPRWVEPRLVPPVVLEVARADGYDAAEAELAAAYLRDQPGTVTPGIARELLARARMTRADVARLLASGSVPLLPPKRG